MKKLKCPHCKKNVVMIIKPQSEKLITKPDWRTFLRFENALMRSINEDE